MIATPRSMRFDWFGRAGREPAAGDYMRAMPSGRTYLVLATRPVQVRVSRGETSRQVIQMVDWPDPLPPDARLFSFAWNSRKRKVPR